MQESTQREGEVMTTNRAYHFIRYADKVFGLSRALEGLSDGREWAQIPLESVVATVILGLVCRLRSLNQIEEAVRGGGFDRALGKMAKPSADTIGYALERMKVEEVREYNSFIIQKARYNKVFSGGTVDGYVVVGIDGTELFKTSAKSRRCGLCCVRVKESREEYYERVVAASYVGEGPSLVLGMRRIEKGQGELGAGIELMKELYWRNTRFCDVIVADALYAASSFINEVDSQGKWVVIRVKQENREIIRDAEGLFSKRGPDYEEEGLKGFKGSRYDVRIWDEEGFTIWDKVRTPLRCLKVEEVRHSLKDGEPVSERSTSYIVTTCPKALVKTITVWKIMHARWDIENEVFHEAKTYCSLGHCFIHDEVATEVMWNLQVIALNLFLLFMYRALREKVTHVGLARAILIGLASLPEPVFVGTG
ncbi:MAG: transposase [Anaerolineae bacterium]